MGQVHVRVSQAVKPGSFIEAENGIGVPIDQETNILVMAIKQEFSEEKGYGVALCLIK